MHYIEISNNNQKNFKTSFNDSIKLNIITEKNVRFKIIINFKEKTSFMSVKLIKKSIHFERINFIVLINDIINDTIVATIILLSACTSVTQFNSKILLEKLKFKK